MVWWLTFDVDYADAPLRWEHANLAAPNLIIINPENQHAHLCYGLAAGVCRTEQAREGPRRYLTAIQRAYTLALGADVNYTGQLVKNPYHPRWQLWAIRQRPYELAELADYVELNTAVPKRSDSFGLGRNCTLFDEGRVWAYDHIPSYWGRDLDTWFTAVLEQLVSINETFGPPLHFSEVRATARSISKWTWARITPKTRQRLITATHTPALQAVRGAKNSRASQARKGMRSVEVRQARRDAQRAQALAWKAKGYTNAEIATQSKVSCRTVSNWLRAHSEK